MDQRRRAFPKLMRPFGGPMSRPPLRRRMRCRNCNFSGPIPYIQIDIRVDEGEAKFYVCERCYSYKNKCGWKISGSYSGCDETPLDPFKIISPFPYCEKHYKEWFEKISQRQCRDGKNCTNTKCKYFHDGDDETQVEELHDRAPVDSTDDSEEFKTIHTKKEKFSKPVQTPSVKK